MGGRWSLEAGAQLGIATDGIEVSKRQHLQVGRRRNVTKHLLHDDLCPCVRAGRSQGRRFVHAEIVAGRVDRRRAAKDQSTAAAGNEDLDEI